jgi:hypothetical protein
MLKDHSTFIIRVKQSKKSAGLLGPEDEGALILLNVRNYSPSDRVSHHRRHHCSEVEVYCECLLLS